MQLDGYLIFTGLSCIFYAFLSVYSFKFRKSPEWFFFTVFAALLSFQGLASLLEFTAANFADKLVWRNIQQIPLYSIPLVFLGMVMSIVGLRRKVVLTWLAVLGTVIIAYWILIFTDSHHRLIRQSIWLEAYGQSERIQIERSNLGDFFFACNYLYGILGLALLLIHFRKVSGIQRTQFALLIAAALFPIAIYPMGFLWHWKLSASVIMLPTAVLLLYAILMHRFLQIRPIAKEKVLEHMTEGILIVEEHDIIIDANPAAVPIAERLWGKVKLVGEHLPKLLEIQPDLLAFYRAQEQGELEVESGGSHFSVRLIPIYVRNRRTGSLVILTDITERKKFENQLIQQATRDDLTQLFNRRHFMELLEKARKECRLADKPISLLLIDVDYFKKINDNFGHLVGDRVLEHFASLLREVITEKDVAGRVGGEEFAVFLPGSTEKMAYEVAEQLRLRVLREPLQVRELHTEICYTISIGVAELKDSYKTLEDWFHQADAGLYASKKNGRNRTTLMAQ